MVFPDGNGQPVPRECENVGEDPEVFTDVVTSVLYGAYRRRIKPWTKGLCVNSPETAVNTSSAEMVPSNDSKTATQSSVPAETQSTLSCGNVKEIVPQDELPELDWSSDDVYEPTDEDNDSESLFFFHEGTRSHPRMMSYEESSSGLFDSNFVCTADLYSDSDSDIVPFDLVAAESHGNSKDCLSTPIPALGTPFNGWPNVHISLGSIHTTEGPEAPRSHETPSLSSNKGKRSLLMARNKECAKMKMSSGHLRTNEPSVLANDNNPTPALSSQIRRGSAYADVFSLHQFDFESDSDLC